MANASFHSAAAKSARPDPDPPAGNDSFAALVDSNAAANRNDNRAQESAPAPRRSDDTPASGNRQRDNAAASDKADKAARNDDRDAAAKARNDKARNDDNAREDGKADAKTNTDNTANTDSKTTTTRRGKSKSDAPTSDKATSDETAQASYGDASSGADQTETTAQNGTAVMTADAVAAAIPAAEAPATSATPATDKAAAPLAIAAAAIAASASIAAETAPAAPAAGTTSPASTNTAQADTAVKANAQGGVGQAVSAQATSGDPSVTGGLAHAASVVAATPAATRSAVLSKGPDLDKKSATTVVEQPGTIDATDTASSAADTIVSAVTAPTEAVAKPKAENGIADGVKADASANSIAPPSSHASPNANAHLAAPDIGQTPVNALGNGLQATGTIPTQPSAAHTTTPVATSQLTATAATGAAVPVSGLAMEIAASVRSGKTRFEIRLDPAELGRIDVRIDVDRNGQVTSHLTVERPETLSMLRQDANQLQRALDNAGLSTGNGGLQFSLRDQSSQGQNDGNQSNPNAHRIVVSEEDSVPAVVAGRSYGRMLGASGGVDIRV
ncbi:flagellar hook-length control protein FliK [Bradyrhizobium sp. WSM 1738]|uniref:flagellar hook-length control protein FliK n=1 Tax=Bradyrhizobium hereditatis TaxID=2821405 RepID=UPI001CE392A4|nr:flagellar hook-length control protein FliK [Bradyrhizobium hereditatis]MCA6114656.1 flagellar hook-length control protein FliK [Bradyrhizobium hereditatis]